MTIIVVSHNCVCGSDSRFHGKTQPAKWRNFWNCNMWPSANDHKRPSRRVSSGGGMSSSMHLQTIILYCIYNSPGHLNLVLRICPKSGKGDPLPPQNLQKQSSMLDVVWLAKQFGTCIIPFTLGVFRTIIVGWFLLRFFIFFVLGIPASCFILFTGFRTVFVFALGCFLPMVVIFFDYNGNYSGKIAKTGFRP